MGAPPLELSKNWEGWQKREKKKKSEIAREDEMESVKDILQKKVDDDEARAIIRVWKSLD